MTDHPKITIILPVFNRRHLIMRAVNSVFAQTHADWELLVMDDGSNDGVHHDILPLIDKDPRVRYAKHANAKLAATRNLGIQCSRGEYITFLDSDDAYKPNHLELRSRYMHENPDIHLVHGGVELVGPPESHYVQDAFHPERKIHLSDCTIGATLFGLRRVFIESGGFKLLPYSAESEFVPRVMQTFKVDKIDFPTYIYYTGLEDSICTIKQKGQTFQHD